MKIPELLEMAKASGLPEVLEAVATMILQYADQQPEDEERDWHLLAQDIQRLASKAACQEEHFLGRRGD